jgi:glycerol kinase
MGEFVGALDQGTTSTRFIVFDHDGREIARSQHEHSQLFPRPGWVEHDPIEIVDMARRALGDALAEANLTLADIAAIGIANQRETTVVWDPRSGAPYANAVVWQDTRTDELIDRLDRDDGDLILRRAGLVPATYFSGAKLTWLLENAPTLVGDVKRPAVFGTIDSWLVWNFTGGPRGGRHVTDVTNASRTMLMDLDQLAWDPELLGVFRVPLEMLPEICASMDATAFGEMGGAGDKGGGAPITAVLGDQQAALVGQLCFSVGDTKVTYGTGNFLLRNSGIEVVRSRSGLLSTVAYQVAGTPAVYALEGSVAISGAAIQWLRDQLGIIDSAAESEALAAKAADNGGVYFVPAFSGLFAPYWRSQARGVVVGLSRFDDRSHLARAALEAIGFQTRDVVRAMEQDCGERITSLKVDGGVTANDLCMQLQADILGIPVLRPDVAETTALGAAYAAGLAVGYWSFDELSSHRREMRRWEPQWSEDRRESSYERWTRAVELASKWGEVRSPAAEISDSGTGYDRVPFL